MTEIQDGQVDEIHDQHDLSDPEQIVDPQHDERCMQEVVEDEVTANICSSVGPVHITREEVPDVARLKDKESNPIQVLSVLDTSSVCETYQ